MRGGRKFIYRHGSRRLIASAGFIAETMRKSLAIPTDRIDVIGESVDPEEFCPGDGSGFREEFDIPHGAPLFGIVAMLRGEKGHDTFLAAARIVLTRRPDARFVIVGSAASGNPVANRVHKQVQEGFKDLKAGHLIMAGFRRDVPRIMRALDCLTVPSRQEAQTLVIPQAFATGKPAIGSRVGGIPEILTDGKTGFLVEPGNAEELADRMLRIANDPELAQRMGRAGREYAERELSVDVKMQQLLESYRKTIAANGKS